MPLGVMAVLSKVMVNLAELALSWGGGVERSDLGHKRSPLQYPKGENRTREEADHPLCAPWLSPPYRRLLSLTCVHVSVPTTPVLLSSKHLSLPQLRVSLHASSVSVWDQTNVDAFQDTPAKPAVKVSTTGRGPSTDVPQSFRKP